MAENEPSVFFPLNFNCVADKDLLDIIVYIVRALGEPEEG